ncbi:hypothetical protein MBLNU230_g6126t1 [Neophaeotheca triangularis]
MRVTTPTSPRQAGGEIFQRAKTSFVEERPPTTRPLSQASEIYETEFEDESDVEGYPPKMSFDSDDGRRQSQTTISSYDEAPTPSPSRSHRRPFELQIKPVEGPTGPHLFRASQSSGEFAFDHALQMSPLLPKEPPRTETAFSHDTVTPTSQQQHANHSIAATLQQSFDSERGLEENVRNWSTEQVVDWMCEAGMDPFVIECFEIHDINGTVLMDLDFDDLKELDIPSFGKRHQLWNAISDLRGGQGRLSPTQTPFQDTSRPCTRHTQRSPSRTRSHARNARRSPSRDDTCETPVDGAAEPNASGGKAKKRRGRKQPKGLDVITPAESVSIVAIEQLLPKPHDCGRGERCAKWRKQQRQMKQLTDEHGLGRFPVSPGKGGRVFVAGDPGNATTAENIVPNVRKHIEEPPRPTSEAVPSVVASSDLLGPGQLPEFALHADVLQHLQSRDPQDNVKQFLNFQHLNSPSAPAEQAYSPGVQTPFASRNHDKPLEMFPAEHVQLPAAQYQRTPSMYRPSHTAPPPEQLKQLPRLSIPRSATAQPNLNNVASPQTAGSICRSMTASPSQVYRFGTPASEMDVPVTAVPVDPVGRDTSSQSVPPGMQYRDQVQLSRSTSRAEWRRPSFAMPALREGQIFDATRSNSTKRPNPSSRTASSGSTSTDSDASRKTPDPAHHDPETKHFGYGEGCTHASWMRKRKTRMLRHEWQDAHFRLRGTQLAMHANARLSANELDSINVDDYAVACSSVASGNKLSAAFKSFGIKNELGIKGKGNNADAAPFAFQLVPSDSGERFRGAGGKTHHFAVKTKDERIDWMRELMLAKALQQKGKGFDVEINGVQR